MSPNQFVDVSTVFSIAPYKLYDQKPGLLPATYQIPACYDQTKPERLLVKTAIHLMTVGGKAKPIRIETPSYVVAKAVVEDNFQSQMWSEFPVCGPGLGWLHGDVSVSDLMTKHKDLYEEMIKQQRNWFLRRCKHTDGEWSKYKNTRVVSDIDRFAAAALGLEPDWMRMDEVFKFNKCPACSTMNDRANAICSNCRCIIDEAKYKTLTFAGAAK